MHALNFQSLGLTSGGILREMGYRKISPGDEIREAVCSLLSDAGKTAKPSCTFTILDGTAGDSSVALQNGTVLHTGNIISGLMSGAARFAVFAATAGTAFQQLQKEVMQEGDMLRVFVLDTIGSCIAERTGDVMETLLEKETGGARHTHRFSPGYCGWPLTDQKPIFELLGGAPCGITLSESSLMRPVKSISGIVGIGDTVRERLYGCGLCDLESCYKRKTKRI